MSNSSIPLFHRLFKRSSSKKEPLCYAPFNNLLINQQGEFKICCNNNSYILGNYPDQSAREIWFGKKREIITQEFLSQKIPNSCKDCIEKGVNVNSPDSKINYSKKSKFSSFHDYPNQIEFLLDNTCNLNCVMCAPNISSSSAGSSSRSKKVLYDELFITQLKPFLKHATFFVFSGGEPFLIPIYSKIWKIILETNPKASIYVQTNATILNEQIKREVEKNKMNIGVSIDSITKETYEKIRKNASFEKTFENLEYFIQHTRSLNKTLALMTTPMTLNADEIPNIVEFCNQKEVRFSLSILEWPVHLAIWSLSSIELHQLVESYKSFMFSSNKSNAVVQQNMKSFLYFTELVDQYQFQKEYFENHQLEIEEKILLESKIVAKNFSSNVENDIEAMTLSSDSKKVLLERSNRLIEHYFEVFSPKFSNPDFFYVFFIKTKTSVYLEHLVNFDDQALEAIINDWLNELNYLIKTKSYNRIIDFDSYE
jgi:MoaA/NifB/PqqE/SkfB family radical SAM enzyme